MGRRAGFDYFEAFERLIAFACDEAKILDSVFRHFNSETLFDELDKMHALEHAADDVNHEIFTHLATDFITPIERDDIIDMAQTLDEVVDLIEDVLQSAYIHNIQEMHPYALEMTSLIDKSVNALRAAMADFKNFKKSNTLKTLLVDVNDYEEAADFIYLKTTRHLYTEYADDPLYVLAWQNLFVALEAACDECEHVAGVMESTIMKNG